MLKGKSIAIGVTGSIACYKSLDLVSRLKKRGADVQVVMTKSACEFVTPMSFRTLSQNPVITSMFKEPTSWEVGHVALADKASIFVIAPATANIIAKFAAGIADDMLTSTVLATNAKKLIVPAMNVHMYENPITQKNIYFLRDMGFEVMEPDEGFLACGYSGKGRFPEVTKIMDKIEYMLTDKKDYLGKRVLITAGPTQENIDPVRFITNHSSGKMGYALAKQAVLRGADVTLISGPSSLHVPSGVKKFIPVKTTNDMLETVLENFPFTDLVIKAAAVADFSPKKVFTQKIKKQDNELTLELGKNPDILKELGKRKQTQVLVGFAAETQNIKENAKKKLRHKNLDLIVVNNVIQKDAGFKSDTNIVTIIEKNGKTQDFPRMSKQKVSDIILDKALPYINKGPRAFF